MGRAAAGKGRWTIVVGRDAAAALLTAMLLLAPGTAEAQQEALRVGYVDMQAIQSQYILPNLQMPVPGLEERVAELQAQFDEESAALDDEARRSLFQEYQERLNREVEEELRRLQADLEKKVREAVAAIAVERGFDAVLFKEVVLYGGTDLTGAVLRRLGVQTNPAGEG